MEGGGIDPAWGGGGDAGEREGRGGALDGDNGGGWRSAEVE